LVPELVVVYFWALADEASSIVAARAAAASTIGLPRRRTPPPFTTRDAPADSIGLLCAIAVAPCLLVFIRRHAKLK
jgi:hypothetical protein